MLVLDHLSLDRHYRPLFSDLCLTLKAGDALLVTGENGIGKSSLLRAISGFLPLSSGHVSFQVSASARRHPLNETPSLFHYIGHLDGLDPRMTVEETMLFWQKLSPDPSNISPYAFLKELQLFHLLEARLQNLSAGQRKRLSLARLWLDQRPLWILDEPLTALDSKTCHFLQEKIQNHRQNDGIVILTSHQDIAFSCSHSLELTPSAFLLTQGTET